MKQVFITAIKLSNSRCRVLEILEIASVRADFSDLDFCEIFEIAISAMREL